MVSTSIFVGDPSVPHVMLGSSNIMSFSTITLGDNVLQYVHVVAIEPPVLPQMIEFSPSLATLVLEDSPP